MVVWQGPIWPPALSGAALIVVGGAFAWSVGTVVATRGMRGDANPVALAAWQMVVGGVGLLVIGFVGEEGLPPLGAREIGLILGIAIVGGRHPLRPLLPGAGQARPPTQVSTWFFLIPVVGVLSAWLLLGERPTLRLVIGLVAVSVGLWLVLAARAPQEGAVGRLDATTVSLPTPARLP